MPTVINNPILKRSRTVRIEDSIWAPFSQKAKNFGLSNTAYLRILLQRNNAQPVNPDFILDKSLSCESEPLDVPDNIQDKIDRVSFILDSALEKQGF